MTALELVLFPTFKVMKSDLSKELANCRYYQVLSDGSTSSSTKEQQLDYILDINEAFHRISASDFTNCLASLNGACVNMGKQEG